MDISPRIGSASDFYGLYSVGNLALHIATRLLIEQPSHQPPPGITLGTNDTEMTALNLYGC